MADLVPVQRALISVSDKTGLADFAKALHEEFNIELISTGGTAKFLRELGLPVTDVAEVTGFPEMMDGRVKTLHPKIHGGLLALRDDAEHVAAMKQHDIQPIDLVCINLYPFKQTVEKPGVTFDEAIENIDIGGPSMIRSAAKNHRFVLVVTSTDRYDKVLGDLRQHGGSSCGKHRLKQAQRAFAHTAEYDGLIAEYLARQVGEGFEGSTGSGTARRMNDAKSGAVATATAVPLPDPMPATGDSATTTYLYQVATRMVAQVGGTEAGVFQIRRPHREFDPVLVHHIRPDESDSAIRAAAIEAFRAIIAPSIEKGLDAAVEVGTPDEGGPQFCLVCLLRRRGGLAEYVVSIICRAADQSVARKALSGVQVLAAYAGLELEKSPQPGMPEYLFMDLTKQQDLRYGENPHQKAALYVGPRPAEASVAFAKQHHGKELSYINLLDADAALSAVKELATPAACIVKHATPCGFATAADLPTAFRNAFAGDPLAAFGGIVALNHPVDRATAEAITSIDKLLEVIVAPSYDADALELLKTRWKNVRLLEVGPIVENGRPRFDPKEIALHKIVGGYLVQERDLSGVIEANLKVVSQRLPTAQEQTDLKLAWLACKHVKSNAIVLARGGMVVGVGGGQVDRVNAARIAIQKAGERAAGTVAASDAFFPFPDGPELLLNAGVTAIIHPGGSVKDKETLELVDRRGAAMILTGQRHFRH